MTKRLGQVRILKIKVLNCLYKKALTNECTLLSRTLSEKHQLDGDFQENVSSVSQYVAVPGRAFAVDGA